MNGRYVTIQYYAVDWLLINEILVYGYETSTLGVFEDISCKNCSAGKYSTTIGAALESACLACPANSHSVIGSKNLTSCICNVGYSALRAPSWNTLTLRPHLSNLHAQNLPRAKNGENFAMATHLQVSGHGARRHAWAITSRALLWQTYIKLECACTLVWISRLPLRQTMLFSARSIWCSIVHLNGNISAPRAAR
jgi:hypothetical protein